MGITKLDLKLKREAAPPVSYLWISLTLGWGLLLWLFLEASWDGKWLVGLGIPIAVCVVVVAWCCWQPRMRNEGNTRMASLSEDAPVHCQGEGEKHDAVFYETRRYVNPSRWDAEAEVEAEVEAEADDDTQTYARTEPEAEAEAQLELEPPNPNPNPNPKIFHLILSDLWSQYFYP